MFHNSCPREKKIKQVEMHGPISNIKVANKASGYYNFLSGGNAPIFCENNIIVKLLGHPEMKNEFSTNIKIVIRGHSQVVSAPACGAEAFGIESRWLQL